MVFGVFLSSKWPVDSKRIKIKLVFVGMNLTKGKCLRKRSLNTKVDKCYFRPKYAFVSAKA